MKLNEVREVSDQQVNYKMLKNFDELCQLFYDSNAENNYHLKVKENGKTVVDIENGVDKLQPKEDHCDSAKSNRNADSCDEKIVETFAFSEDTPEPASSEEVTSNDMKWITPDVLAISDDVFVATNKIKHLPLDDNGTEICFTHSTGNGWIPGITNKQLVNILLYRFRNNPEKYKIVRQLLF